MSMGTFEKLMAMANMDLNYNQKLYRLLKDKQYNRYPYEKSNLGGVISCICYGWDRMVRYLLNHRLREAYEVTSESGLLLFLESSDIENVKEVGMRAFPPTVINRFIDGVAFMECCMREDPMAWVDDDGFGMGREESFYIYGIINERLEAKSKFRKLDSEDIITMYRDNPRQMIADFKNNG